MKQLPEQTIPDQQADLLRVLYFTRIAKNMINDLIVKNDALSETLRNGTFRAVREMEELERKLDNVTTRQFDWLKQKLDSNVMWDMASLIDLVGRIGKEESPDYYESFLSILVHAINAIFYFQSSREKISLEKYRQLLQMVVNEVQYDAISKSGQFIISEDGSVYIKVIERKETLNVVRTQDGSQESDNG